MKHSFKNLFMVVMILVSLIGSSIQPTPVNALGAVTKLATNLPVPLEVGALYGVWSADASNVFAVGYGNQVGNPKVPVAYRKNGASWTSTQTSLPSGWNTGELYSVWGTNTSNVFAVGAGGITTSSLPLVSYWNGSNWTPSTPNLPSSPVSSAGYLYGVWGFSTGDVYAVGKGVSSANYAMISHWNGSNWSSTALTLPSGWNRAELRSVWGPSATNIFAVGNGGSPTGSNLPLIYRYNGSTWTSSTLSLPAGWGSGYLSGVWGSSATDVYVVGAGSYGSTTAPLLYHYNGSTWSSVSVSLPSTSWASGQLKGVWGFGTDVYAVGFGVNGGTTVPLLYRKTSTGWAVSSFPPDTYVTEHFEGISGSSATDVYVAGLGRQIEAETPIIYHAGADTVAPGNITNFAALSGKSPGAIKLSWTAPADDSGISTSGPVTSYLVKYSTSALADCSSGMLATSPVVTAPGNTQVMRINSLSAGVRYYFAVCAVDEEGNQSSPAATGNAIASTSYLPPDAVTLIAPSGTGAASQPTYIWNDNIDATWYYLWVEGPSGTAIKTWYTPAQAGCNGTICSITPSKNLGAGAHRWWVQTYNPGGNGSWSSGMDFTVPVPTQPGKTTLFNPSGNIGTNTPTFTWAQVTGATSYYLLVEGPSGTAIKTWYNSTQASCNGSTCSVTPTSLGAGTYRWWVQTWNSVGYGPWSDRLDFTVTPPALPGKTTLSTPTGSVSTTTPTFTWSEVSGATYYYLWVSNSAGTAMYKTWYTPTQASCSGTCSVTPTTALGAGDYRWWVQTYNSAGYGPWSDGLNFTVTPPSLPGKTTLSSPNGSTGTTTPTFTWSEVSGATWYYLWVSDAAGTPIYKIWYTPTQASCSGTCSVTPTTALSVGSYRWWVQTYNSAGYGPWSDGLNFTVP